MLRTGAAAVLLVLVLLACGACQSTPGPVVNFTPRALRTPPPANTPGPTASPDDLAARALMYRFWTLQRAFDLNAVRAAGESGHPGLVPPLIESTVFSFEEDVKQELGEALAKLTGERFGGGFESYRSWYRWLGQHPEIVPVPGYAGWKGQVYSEIAPGLAGLLYDDMPARVPVWAVQGGGVDRDGIRPLEDPNVVTARDATYLEPDEVVIGVVVNGEARAYPKRIMNVHELANDVVGGHPITVVL